MKKLLLQLDTSRLPSVFDQVVAYDAGVDHVMSYGGVVETDVRDLIHGCIFTRGPKDLHNTAVWIGGANMSAGEQLLAVAQDALFDPFKVSIMLDSNGSNTTAVAAVVKIEQAVDVRGKRVVVVGGTGPVGLRAAGLLAKDGAEVLITSRKPEVGERAKRSIKERFGGTIESTAMGDSAQAAAILDGANILLNAGAAGIMMVPHAAWAKRPGLAVAVDLNAVPPLGIEGIEVNEAGAVRDGVTVFGAFGVGNFKTKLHKACVARLFERNDFVLDAETIAQVAREMVKK